MNLAISLNKDIQKLFKNFIKLFQKNAINIIKILANLEVKL